MEKEIVYFELNNWFRGRDYPPIDGIYSLMEDKFTDDEWCKENKLCVLCGYYDMSLNWCVSATKEWVEQNLQQLLSNDTYTYDICYHSADGDGKTTYTKKYLDFVRYSDEDGEIRRRFDWKFLEYCEENFGVTYCNDFGEIDEDADE